MIFHSNPISDFFLTNAIQVNHVSQITINLLIERLFIKIPLSKNSSTRSLSKITCTYAGALPTGPCHHWPTKLGGILVNSSCCAPHCSRLKFNVEPFTWRSRCAIERGFMVSVWLLAIRWKNFLCVYVCLCSVDVACVIVSGVVSTMRELWKYIFNHRFFFVNIIFWGWKYVYNYKNYNDSLSWEINVYF